MAKNRRSLKEFRFDNEFPRNESLIDNKQFSVIPDDEDTLQTVLMRYMKKRYLVELCDVNVIKDGCANELETRRMPVQCY